MERKPTVVLLAGLLLCIVGALGAAQWHARLLYLTRGWESDFPDPVYDTPGAAGMTMPRACVNAPLLFYDAEDLVWALDTIEAAGFGWVRLDIPWAMVEPAPGQWEWAVVDRAVQAAHARGLRLLAVLAHPPDWSPLPPDPQTYAQYASAVAMRYGDAIAAYQIWHNPNLAASWGGQANAFEYTALLAQAAQAIRAVDPDARIVLGSLAPTVEQGDRNYAEDLFLEMLYAAGAAPYFDVVGAQPYGFATGPDDRRISGDVLNFSRVIRLREVMTAHGEKAKAIWAVNLGWNSKPDDWPGPESIWGEVDPETQAVYTVDALARITREWPWMGVTCVTALQPRPEGVLGSEGEVPDAEEHWGFALIGPDGIPRPVYHALQAWLHRPPVAAPGVYRADTDLATFEGTWTLGPQGADIGEHGEHHVRLPFEGTGVALTVRRGPYRAFLYVTVDGEPAPALPRDPSGRAYVVLYDPLAAIATVPLARGLPPGRHVVEVEADRGWGQWALADWRVVWEPPWGHIAWVGYLAFGAMGAVGLILAFRAAPRVSWGRLGSCLRRWLERLGSWGQVVLTCVAVGVTLLAAWQTLIGESAFRRLGERGTVAALVLSAFGFYLSPWFALALASGAVMSVLVVLRPDLGLVLTIVSAPFYLHPLSLFGKSFALSELVLLPTLMGWALQWLSQAVQARRPPWRLLTPRQRQLAVPLFYLVAVGVVSTLRAEHLREALRELRLVILEPTLFFLALVTLPLSRDQRWRLLDALVLCAVIVAFIGLVQYARGDVITAEGGIARLRSVYGSPNNVGLLMGRVLPLALAVGLWTGGGGQALNVSKWWYDVRHSPRRVLYLAALLPIGGALVLSLSRGALILGVPAALITLGLLAGKQWRQVTLIVLGVGALALVPLLRTPRFAGLFDPTQGTGRFRVALWRSTLMMVADHPLLGVGPDNFLYAYRTRYVLPTAWEEFNLSHPHNVFLDYAARLGLLGLAGFLWTQFAFWRQALPLFRTDDPARRALVLGIVAAMVDVLAHGLVDMAVLNVDLALIYALLLGLMVRVEEDWREDPPGGDKGGVR